MPSTPIQPASAQPQPVPIANGTFGGLQGEILKLPGQGDVIAVAPQRWLM